MPEPIVLTYLGERDNTADTLMQARALHAAALAEYRSVSRRLRTELARKAVSLKRGLRSSSKRLCLESMSALGKQAAQLLDELYLSIVKQANDDCLRLALSVASEIIATQVRSDTAGLSAKIEEQIAKLIDTRAVAVTVSANFQEKISSLLNAGGLAKAKVSGSDEIAPGNAVIDCSAGRIEIDWKEELQAMSQRLADSLAQKVGTHALSQGS